MKIYKTRFATLGFTKLEPGLWRIMALDDKEPAAVGPLYASKAELLGDLTRYARENWNLS
jgi:hypothetical protein